MSYISDEWEKAKKRPRDAHGHYVKRGTSAKDTIATEVKSSTPVDKIKDMPDRAIEKPIVSLRVNNPFKKLLYWLKDVRKKQTTTFNFKISIPLIALPIFLIVLGAAFQFFFNLGKNENKEELILTTPTPTIFVTTTIPVEQIVSKYGVVKATYQISDLLNKMLSAIGDSSMSTESSIEATSVPNESSLSRYVLLEKNNKVIFLIVPSEIKMSKYINLEVIITGKYNEQENRLTIPRESNIEIVQ